MQISDDTVACMASLLATCRPLKVPIALRSRSPDYVLKLAVPNRKKGEWGDACDSDGHAVNGLLDAKILCSFEQDFSRKEGDNDFVLSPKQINL